MTLFETWIDYLTGIPILVLYPSLAVILFIFYVLGTAIYNIFFHPLRHFPGPLLCRVSKLPWFVSQVQGEKPRWIRGLHDQYGPVVRVAPNFLTFTDARAWKDIYGHRSAGRTKMPKSPVFYRVGKNDEPNIIFSNDEEHSRLRSALSHGFSDRALRQQESIIMRHVEYLQQRLEEVGEGGKKPLNMDRWYNWATFDIIGDLVFAQDFCSLQNAVYDSLMSQVFSSVRIDSFFAGLSFLGLSRISKLAARRGNKNLLLVMEYIAKRLRTRMASKDERPDLIEGLLKYQEKWNMSFAKLQANAVFLSIAGSETTATGLSGATYLLLQNPHILEKLRDELDSKFRRSEDITFNSVASLPYLQAVINESLRHYPPVTGGMVRQVPDGGAVIAGNFVPGGTQVEIPQLAVNYSKLNWKDPNEFRPERFLPTDGPQDTIEALQPFSFGPRNCLGMNLAYAEMRVILARVVFGFEWKLAPGSENWMANQKTYALWIKPLLPVYLTPKKRTTIT